MIEITEEMIQSFTKREMLLYRALEIVCKMLRENPMGDIGLYPPGMIKLLPGGEKRDPDGKEYINYFLIAATMKLHEENKL